MQDSYVGRRIRVHTSLIFKDQYGIVTEENKRGLTVDFNGRIGKYSFENNTFSILQERSSDELN